MQLVWAFRPIAKLQYKTGFVECPDAVAKALLDSGDVQRPNIGALHLKEIDHKYQEPRTTTKKSTAKTTTTESSTDSVAETSSAI